MEEPSIRSHGERTLLMHLSQLTSRPHVAANIVGRLSVCDVVNCLKVSKMFRQFIIDTLAQLPELKVKMDSEASRFMATEKTLVATELGSMARGYHWDQERNLYSEEKLGFSINGSLWIFCPGYTEYCDDDTSDCCPCAEKYYRYASVCYCGNNNTLAIFDLQDKKFKDLGLRYPSGSRPKLKILPGQKILLQDASKLLLFAKKRASPRRGRKNNWCTVSRTYFKTPTDLHLRNIAVNDSIHTIKSLSQEEDEKQNWELTICSVGDNFVKKSNTIETTLHPKQILEKVKNQTSHLYTV